MKEKSGTFWFCYGGSDLFCCLILRMFSQSIFSAYKLQKEYSAYDKPYTKNSHTNEQREHNDHDQRFRSAILLHQLRQILSTPFSLLFSTHLLAFRRKPFAALKRYACPSARSENGRYTFTHSTVAKCIYEKMTLSRTGAVLVSLAGLGQSAVAGEGWCTCPSVLPVLNQLTKLQVKSQNNKTALGVPTTKAGLTTPKASLGSGLTVETKQINKF